MERAVDTIPTLLAPFKTSAIVEKTGASLDTVYMWRRAEGRPGVQYIRALAELTNRSFEAIVAAIEATPKAVA